MVDICVIFDRRQAFVIFTLAVVESLVEDQIPISVLMAFMALPNICPGHPDCH